MLKYEMVPVVDVYDLQDEIIETFGSEIMEDKSLLTSPIFYECGNDSYQTYWYDEDPPYSENEEEEKDNQLQRCINTILRKNFPNHTSVLLAISW